MNDEISPTLHYGQEWSWDYTRPEAIEALRQMEECHNGSPGRPAFGIAAEQAADNTPVVAHTGAAKGQETAMVIPIQRNMQPMPRLGTVPGRAMRR